MLWFGKLILLVLNIYWGSFMMDKPEVSPPMVLPVLIQSLLFPLFFQAFDLDILNVEKVYWYPPVMFISAVLNYCVSNRMLEVVPISPKSSMPELEFSIFLLFNIGMFTLSSYFFFKKIPSLNQELLIVFLIVSYFVWKKAFS